MSQFTKRTYCFAADCAVFFSDCMGAESWWNAAKRNRIIKSKASPKAISLGGERIGRIAQHRQHRGAEMEC